MATSVAAPARFVELDALRGIAAMVVVLSHYALITNEAYKPHSRTMLLLRPLVAGHEAVILFFLLSGFVLSLSTWKGSILPYKDFLVRRVFRIYVPYLGALAIAVAACAVFYQRSQAAVPINFQTWSQPPTVASVVEHVAFLGQYDDARYNRAFWSLIVEMRISLIFPFVCMGLRKMKSWAAGLAAAALSAGSIFLSLGHAESSRTGWANTGHYLAFFIIGALLARRLSRQPWPAIPEGVRHAMAPASVLLFGYAATLHRLLPGMPIATQEMLLDWPTGVGAFGLIYLAATHRATKRTLGHFIPRYLGHISYSLYLLHTVVLLALVSMLYKYIPVAAFFPIYIVLAIGVATAFNRLVEMPAMQMGRRFTRPKPPAKAFAVRG